MPLPLEPDPVEIPLEAVITIMYIPTRRRMYLWPEVQETAAKLSFEALVKLIDRAIAHDSKARELDLLWEGFRNGVLASNPGVPEVDAQVDRTLTGVRDAALAQGRGAPDDDEIHDLINTFLETLFPSGLFGVTSMPFTEEVVAVERIVHLLQGELAPMVSELGLARLVKRLATLVVEYRALLAATPKRPDFDTVRAARNTGQGYLRQVIAMVVGRFHGDTAEHRDARARLLAPIMQQQQALRDYQSARRRGSGGEPDLEPPGDELPGDELPGDELPGDELPGDELPGDELPGDELPGDELPGDELPGDEPPADQ